MQFQKIKSRSALYVASFIFGVTVASGLVYTDSRAAEPDGQREVQGSGQINKIKAEHQMVNITHEPIVEMNWPKMRMNFRTSDDVDLANLKPGQKVDFIMQVDQENNYQITDIKIVE